VVRLAIDYKKLGTRIKERRLHLQLTQEQLAELCQISNIYISHIETSKANPSLEVLFTRAENLEVTPDYLLMDSLYQSTAHIEDEIAGKLQRCSPENIHLINRMIDVVIECQKK